MVKSEMFSLPNVLGRARVAKEMVGESELGVVATFDLAESECISEHVRHLHQAKHLNFTPVECPISQGHGADCDIFQKNTPGKKHMFSSKWRCLACFNPVQTGPKTTRPRPQKLLVRFDDLLR